MRYLSFYYFNCSLQCRSFEVWKSLPRVSGVSLAKFFKMDARSSAKSELRVNSVDFEVGENDQFINEKQLSLVLRA